MGVLVDELGLRGELGVDLHDLSRHRRVQLRDGLDRFDRPELLAGGERPSDLGQLQKHDVAQLVLCVVGDAHTAAVAIDGDPLVVLGVAKLLQRGIQPVAKVRVECLLKQC